MEEHAHPALAATRSHTAPVAADGYPVIRSLPLAAPPRRVSGRIGRA